MLRFYPFFQMFHEFPAPPGAPQCPLVLHATALLRLRVGGAGHGVAMAPQPPEDGVLLHLDHRLGGGQRVLPEAMS